jgi:hypothetical protein
MASPFRHVLLRNAEFLARGMDEMVIAEIAMIGLAVFVREYLYG